MSKEQVKTKKAKQPLEPGQKKIMIVLGSMAGALAVLGIILISVL